MKGIPLLLAAFAVAGCDRDDALRQAREAALEAAAPNDREEQKLAHLAAEAARAESRHERDRFRERVNFALGIDRRLTELDADLLELRADLHLARGPDAQEARALLAELERRRARLETMLEALAGASGEDRAFREAHVEDELAKLEQDLARAAASVGASRRAT